MKLYENYMDKIGVYKKKKVNDDNFKVPKFCEYTDLLHKDFRVSQLKKICGYYKQKKTGNKQELIKRVYEYLYLSSNIVSIQSLFRKKMVTKYITLHGPGYKKRDICINETDFYTLDKLADIPYNQFYTFKDRDNHIYGVDIKSLFQLYKTSKDKVYNPYNRSEINSETIENMHKIIKLSKMVGIDIDVEIVVDRSITPKKNFELRVLSLFQNIDLLGHYSNPDWFLSLSRSNKIKFIRELYDLWFYRLGLTFNIKRHICPRGNPFRRFSLNLQVDIIAVNEETLNKYILCVMEEFILYGVTSEYRNLAASYILTCLTLVNEEAAIALPWLYQAASH